MTVGAMTAAAPRVRGVAVFGALVVAMTARPLAAQQGPGGSAHPPLRLELRGDLIAGRATTVQGALGVGVALGNYVRASAVAGAGATAARGQSRSSGRADGVVRFLLDPFGERRWGPYGGAGVSTVYTAGGAGERGAWRGYLLAVAGLEGPSGHGFLPALELGLGGGTRVGVVLRRAPDAGR